MQINNFTRISKKPNKNGFYDAYAKPFSGASVRIELSAGAIMDLHSHAEANLDQLTEPIADTGSGSTTEDNS